MLTAMELSSELFSKKRHQEVDIVDDLQVPGVVLNRQAFDVEAVGNNELERGGRRRSLRGGEGDPAR